MKKVVGSALALIAGVCALAVPAHAGELHWSGDVDDTATITLSGSNVDVKANMNGVGHEHHDVNGSLSRSDSSVSLNKQSGRGRIWIVQQPSSRNGYKAVVRVKDNAAGSDHYSFTLRWDDGGGRGPHGGHGRH